MTSNFNEDQAEQLRRRFEGLDNSENLESEKKSVDVLRLPSRKDKFQKIKEKKKNDKNEMKKKETTDKKRRRKLRFPLVRILLFLFLLLIVLVTTYPIWIDKLNL